MITLSKAILYDNTRKAKSLTWGIYIPFVSDLAAKKVAEIRNKMSGVDDNEMLSQFLMRQNLALRQKIYEALNLGLKYGKGEQLKYNIELFEELFFIKYDKEKHKNYVAERIYDLDNKIIELLPKKTEGEGRTLSQTVSDVELILNNGTIDRQISLVEFKDYYDNALLVLKERNKNG